VTISFTAPANAPAEPVRQSAGAVAIRLTGTKTLRSINFVGVSDEARTALMDRLALHIGDNVDKNALLDATKRIMEFDEHLKVGLGTPAEGEVALTVIGPNPGMKRTEPVAGDRPPLRIGGSMQAAKLVYQPRPIYPPEAKAARVQGKVTLQAVIGKDGTIQKLEVLSGDALLVQSAIDAVRQWVYEPTLLNGDPVDVLTQIDVNYTLSQ
jgi:TonB family protein